MAARRRIGCDCVSICFFGKFPERLRYVFLRRHSMHAVDVDIRFSVSEGDGAARNVWYMDMIFDGRSLIHQDRPKNGLNFTYMVKTMKTVRIAAHNSLGTACVLVLSTLLPHSKHRHRHGDFQPPVARSGTGHSPTSSQCCYTFHGQSKDNVTGYCSRDYGILIDKPSSKPPTKSGSESGMPDCQTPTQLESAKVECHSKDLERLFETVRVICCCSPVAQSKRSSPEWHESRNAASCRPFLSGEL
jgi:hypothetical protein